MYYKLQYLHKGLSSSVALLYLIVVLIFIVSGPSGMYMLDSYISITIHNEYLV